MFLLGGKTPISALNEYLVTKKMKPIYELAEVGGEGPNNPIFKFYVKVNDMQCEGQGSSKQEARHRAAENMLKLLQLDNSKVSTFDENCEEFFENDSKENYVGNLKEYCLAHFYPEPEYVLEEEAGPPHSKIFKIVCFVSKLKEYGIAKTKKLAKHHSALKMLERLKKLNNSDVSDEFLSVVVPQVFETAPKVNKSIISDEAIEKYNAIKSSAQSSSIHKYPASFYKDHHRAYVGLQDTSPTLQNVIDKKVLVNESNALNIIEEMTKELGVTWNAKEIRTSEESNAIILTILLVPPIAGFGNNTEEAAVHLLDTLSILCVP